MFNKIITQVEHTYDTDTDTDIYNTTDNYTKLTTKFICNGDCEDPNKINKETYKKEVIKQYEEIIETKTSLINKVFMDNQKDKKIPAHA